MSNLIIWFDLPVKNLDRAIRFYSGVLGRPAQKQEMPGMSFAVLHDEKDEAAGCLTPGGEGDELKPSADGVMAYFNCQGRLDEAIDMVEVNGGKVLRPKHPIGPYGFRAVALDSEGNRIALHSM